MPTVAELSAPYENFMLTPRQGPAVCDRCFNFTRGYGLCYACAHSQNCLEVVLPISYSIGGEQLHRSLLGYKRFAGEVARRLTLELAAVLWRFLEGHERCVSRAMGIDSFELVTSVPSGDRDREPAHPLRRIAGELVAPTRGRYRRLLRRSDRVVQPRVIDAQKFQGTTSLNGQAVLLLDDTWTTGASAQSAAAALRSSGSGPVGAVVIGRYLNREWHENDRRLRGIDSPFDWARCALCIG